MTQERARKYEFTEPIHLERVMLFVTTESDITCGTVEGLTGKLVGVLQGWSYGDEFDSAVRQGQVSTFQVRSDDKNLELLMIGRIDAFLAVKESAEKIIARSKYASRVFVFPVPLATHETYMAFPRGYLKPGQMEKVNKAIRTMRTDGTLNQMERVMNAPTLEGR